MHLINKLTLAVCACIGSTTYASVSIENSGFEDQFDGWESVQSASISTSDIKSGSRSAKMTGSSGYFSQEVTVEQNTTYLLSAYVLGDGKIGAINDSGSVSVTTSSTTADSDGWKKLTVEFNSESDSTVRIYGDYEDGEGRFDDFSIIEAGSSSEAEEAIEEENEETANCSVVQIQIAAAYDDGDNDGHYPAATIDDDLDAASRWSAEGEGKTITYNLGAEVSIDSLNLAWFKGDERDAYFDVEVSTDNSSWSTVLSNQESEGTEGLSSYDLEGVIASYLRVVGQGNSANSWNSLIETQINGCIVGEIEEPIEEAEEPIEEAEEPIEEVEEPIEEVEEPVVIGDLDPSAAPSTNFDLTSWYLSVPTDENDNGKADDIKENQLNEGYEDSEYFYTGSDGGMVFKCPIDGYKTSTSTDYTRTELREMLRTGDTSIETEGVNGNNWVLSTAPDKDDAGGYNGVLTATLAVNHVTTTGDDDQIGRVIVGQIHANDDEPLRIYYRKLPNNSKGSIYFAHEPANGNSEQWYELIGSRDDEASNPSDGIELNEQFSYAVDVQGDDMTVTIKRDGKPDVVSEVVDMSDSGYSDGGQFLYFKAGVYNQNKSGDDDDYVQATFYSLDNSHTNWQ